MSRYGCWPVDADFENHREDKGDDGSMMAVRMTTVTVTRSQMTTRL